MTDLTDRLLDAALIHVPFDGWGEAALRAAAADCGVEFATAQAAFPRGGVDMALAFHRRGDAQMLVRLAEQDLSQLRMRDRIALAVRLRLEATEDRELVRRGTTLFALPMHAAEGARALWGTADAIWTALGDSATDYNWYTKRATLSGVYSATVLYWLGDDSPNSEATWAFLDRRIDEVMQIERVKGTVSKNPVLRTMFAGPRALLSCIKAPSARARPDLPGYVPRPPQG
jgi:ubiquinone biosynthesis protein COQ9